MENLDLVEGVGESSSPPPSFGGGGAGTLNNYDIRNDVYNRLIELGNEEALSNPRFRELLDAHFNRLPPSYIVDVNLDRVEDVLLHQRLLALAKDPEKRPAFHVSFLENYGATEDGTEDEQDEAAPVVPSTSLKGDHELNAQSHGRDLETGFESCYKLEGLNLDVKQNSWHLERRQAKHHIPIHEVIFSAVDKPKLLSQLSALLSEIGLNIREAHVFSTTDGYSLDVFVVDGWPIEDTDSLTKAVEEAILRSEGSWSGSSHFQSAVGTRLVTEAGLRSSEIDKRLLKIGDKIASGSCGDLYRGVYLGQDVAVKVLRSEHLTEATENEFAHEVAILREVQHENIVRFIGACTKFPALCIVTEYMPGGSLYNYLHKDNKTLKLSELLKFAIDVCKGMEYLHHNNIIHRDLKTANLLIDNHQVVKVADFGVARFLNQDGVMTAETGTYRWMAPEVINHQPYDQNADIFSFGIVLWELVTAKIPYETFTPLQAALGVRQGLRPQLPERTHPKLLDLMKRCWDAFPLKRPPFSVMKTELEELLHEVEEAAAPEAKSSR